MTQNLAYNVKLAVLVILTLVITGCAGSMGGSEDAKFESVEVDGVKVWRGGGTINLKDRTKPLTLKVTNTLAADHGFAIDTMKVKEVIKAGEERTITVPLGNIDMSLTPHRVYCQLHPKHGVATLTVNR